MSKNICPDCGKDVPDNEARAYNRHEDCYIRGEPVTVFAPKPDPRQIKAAEARVIRKLGGLSL